MTPHILIALFLSALALTPLARAQSDGGRPGADNSIYESLLLDVQKQPDPAKSPPKKIIASGHRYAVLVGVAEAAGQVPLPFCLNDVTRLGEALTAGGYECTLLSERESKMPTHANALAAIRRMAARAGPTDQILVYMSTHGGAPDGVPLLALKDEPMTLREIKEAMAASPALVRVLILDACRDEKGFRTETAEIRDLHVILSCRPDEESANSPNGVSLFTEVLIEALTGCAADRIPDGQLELDEVLHYLDENVPARANLYEPGSHQNPTRTVVDPRSLNPIFASCSPPDADNGPVTTAVEGSSTVSLANDLIISSALVGRITLMMTRADLEASMGEPALGFSDDYEQTGSDVVGYINEPQDGDILWVFFKDHQVMSVMVMGKGPCRGDFDLGKARAGFAELCDGRSVEDTSEAIVGTPMQTIYDLLGCPSGGLALQSGSGRGAAVYENVPRQGREVRVVYEPSGVISISVDQMADSAR